MLWARCLSISCRRSALRVCSVHVASSVATAMSGTVRTSSLVPIRQLGITGSPRGGWLHRDAILLQVGSIVLGRPSRSHHPCDADTHRSFGEATRDRLLFQGSR